MQIVRDTSTGPLKVLNGKIVAIIGYGNQGRAQAANLRDAGVNVVIGLREDSTSVERACSDGLAVKTIAAAAKAADLVILAMPDEVHGEVYESAIEPSMRPGSTLGVMHGFSLRFGVLKPRPGIGVIMVAPKGPGATLRERFTRGQGIPCLCAVHQNSPTGDGEALALAWACGNGCLRAAAIFTTVAAETETDLFGEQTVLCGGVTSLIRTAFETLVEAGYAPELAYIECCHELKQVADLIYAHGLAGMHNAISGTAEFGSYIAQERLVDDGLRAKLKSMLEHIRAGRFATAMLKDVDRGSPWRQARRAASAAHPIECAGEAVRALMPWLTEEGQAKP